MNKEQMAEFKTMQKEVIRGIICAEACEGIKDPVAAIQAAKEALNGVIQSFTHPEIEIRAVMVDLTNIRKALALLEGK